MATLQWRGKAPAVAQVSTLTVGGTIASETFTASVGGVDVAVSATGSEIAADIAAALADAWNALAHPYFEAVTASADSAVVTLTADVAGVPFVVSAQATGSATLTAAADTASSGPHDWSTPANWSTGSVPANSDTVVFADSEVPVLWGLDQASVSLALLRIEASFTGVIGLPDARFTQSSAAASDSANEYRGCDLQIGAAAVRIGEGGASQAAGSPRIRIDTGSEQTTLYVAASALTAADGDEPVVRWTGTHASNAAHITGGSVGIAPGVGQTATLAQLNVGRASSAVPPVVLVGEGAALGTLTQAAGTVHLAASAAAVSQSGGELVTSGSAAVTTASIAGEATLSATGTITTLRVLPGGAADFASSPQPRTVTNCELHHGSTLNLSSGNPLHVTFSNDIHLVRCGLADVTLRSGDHVAVALGAIA